MITFLVGLVILITGGFFYGKVCEKAFGPDDRETPATRLNDGVDYIPMKKWRNCLIQLLNIAGTGPVLGPIQGILFGPVAFITIPIGCIICGAFHDYMCGMISMRNDGKQLPALIQKYMGTKAYALYNVFVCITLLLVGTVFIYTPGDIFVTQVLGQDGSASNTVIWIVYGIIFAYYIIATLFPIDKIIGKVYPYFGAVLILSAIGVFAGILIHRYPLDELSIDGMFTSHPQGIKFFPVFFVTVACGIVSGFHSTQTPLISRTVKSEKEGRATFYNMMIAEGVIAMIWAAAAMGVINLGLAGTDTPATGICGVVATDLLGKYGGIIALMGIVILAVTSGDTALRSLRVIIADSFKIDQSRAGKRLAVSMLVFVIVAVILIYSKIDPEGFGVLWRYFAWANQTISVFALAMMAVYMIKHKKPYIMALGPGVFYAMVVFSFILNAKIGFNLSWPVSYAVAGVMTVIYTAFILYCGKKKSDI